MNDLPFRILPIEDNRDVKMPMRCGESTTSVQDIARRWLTWRESADPREAIPVGRA